MEDARRLVTDFVIHYNEVPLHSAIGYLAPKDKLEGRAEEIFAERDRKLAEARECRRQKRETRRQRPAQADPSRPAIDFAAVRDTITITQVLTLLGFVPRTDYGGRSLYPRQVFFPMAVEKDSWARLARKFKAEIDEELIDQYRGTVSIAVELGPNGRVAVKIVDDRGTESLKIVAIE